MKQDRFECSLCGSQDLWAGKYDFAKPDMESRGVIICLGCGKKQLFNPPLEWGTIEITEKGRQVEQE